MLLAQLDLQTMECLINDSDSLRKAVIAQVDTATPHLEYMSLEITF